MNTRYLLWLFLGAFAVLPWGANAQTSADPVASEIAGFSFLEADSSASGAEPQVSLRSVGLLRPIEYQGKCESLRGKLLTDLDASWTEDQFNPGGAKIADATHYIELTTGPLAGAIFDIVRTEAASKRLTLGQLVPRTAGVAPEYRIRRHWTLAALFGAANEAGLQPGNETTADLVSIYNGRVYVRYYYSNVDGATGWRAIGAPSIDAANRQIYPDEGFTITRRGDGAVSALVKGVVKVDRSLIPIARGFNLVANVYQTPLTLAASQLYTRSPATGVRAGRAAGAADAVVIYGPAGAKTYFYQTSARDGVGWRSTDDLRTDAGAVEIPVGAAFAIIRKGGAGFTWKAPAPQ